MEARALHALLLVTFGLTVVLLARRPARRAFGAGPAFTLWSLPVLLAPISWLPAPAHAWVALPTLRATAGAAFAGGQAQAHTLASHAITWLWLLGATVGLLRLGMHYLRLRRAFRPLPAGLLQRLAVDVPARDLQRLRLHPSGPAVLWAPCALVLLPADFAERFAARERRLVLRHELAHLRRGDPLWSLVAELACALLWFHPLAWLALPRFRLDQELACDERVLREAPGTGARYARTLLHSTGMASRPALIPWLAESQLKERLTMIERRRPTALRRCAGFAALAMTMAGGLALAHAAMPPQSAPASQDTTDNRLIPPHYPAAALHNREQGLVMLEILVHADGSVGTITYDAKRSTTQSAELIAAAAEAARQWHFNPQMKNGKPVEGYARVPIDFSLDKLAPAAPARTSSKS